MNKIIENLKHHRKAISYIVLGIVIIIVVKMVLTPPMSHYAIQCGDDKVASQLKSPSTAAFEPESGIHESYIAVGDYWKHNVSDDSYTVRSYVDAQNSFGATGRQYFTCEETYVRPYQDACVATCTFD